MFKLSIMFSLFRRRNYLLVLMSILLIISASAQDKNTYYPFTIGDKNEITATIESKPLYPRYKNIFEKYGYSGNGYCWEGHITQILEKLDPSLLKHIEMDPEAGAFFAYADSKATQVKFVKLLSPIFSDETKLVVWIKKANHARISD